MSVLKVRLPYSKHARIIEELTTIATTQQDQLKRFTLRASRGDRVKGLAVLDELNAAFDKR